jgi:ribonuclease R
MNHGKKRNLKRKPHTSGGPPHHIKKRHKHVSRDRLDEVTALIVSEVTGDGDLIAIPKEWPSRKQPPLIYIVTNRHGPAPAMGDSVLASLRRIGAHEYNAHVIRILPKEVAKPIVGIFVPTIGDGGLIEPISRKVKESYSVAKEDVNGAQPGELVKASTVAGVHIRGLAPARIDARLGDARAPRAASLIAASIHNLPSEFSSAALAEAEAAAAPVLTPGREDLRGVPLVTIDGEDARDFDDAIFAEPDSDPKNEGGFHLIVAIADVAHYVAEHSALDAEAFTRGNSAYFPDRVIPMLPERLSNGLCSLKPDEDRYCLAVHIWIDANGNTRRYQFTRAIMRSKARLTYEQAENPTKLVGDPAVAELVKNLLDGYRALAKERDSRQTLEINLPEYKVYFDAQGNVERLSPRMQLESHRLIEAYMVTANVAAADYLLTHRAPGIYRIHEPPSEEKIEALRIFLGASGYSFPKGAIETAHLNRVLRKAATAPNAAIINSMVLRSQMQAYYEHKNFGHFGLSLKQYCHFTSPIRRYADLIVHRSLAGLLDSTAPYRPTQNLKEIAAHISETERTAMMAERDALDRYKISYLSSRKEKVFHGIISSVNEYGLFVSLDGNGITGFVPVHNLGGDFFVYNARLASFKGRQGNITYTRGDQIVVRVMEADALRGSLIFRPESEEARQSHAARPSHKKEGHRPQHHGKTKRDKKRDQKRDHKKAKPPRH